MFETGERIVTIKENGEERTGSRSVLMNELQANAIELDGREQERNAWLYLQLKYGLNYAEDDKDTFGGRPVDSLDDNEYCEYKECLEELC